MNTFDLEDKIMKCWSVTDDIDLVADVVGEEYMAPETKDKLLNLLIGMREMYNIRFNNLFDTFENMVHNGQFRATRYEFTEEELDSLEDAFPPVPNEAQSNPVGKFEYKEPTDLDWASSQDWASSL